MLFSFTWLNIEYCCNSYQTNPLELYSTYSNLEMVHSLTSDVFSLDVTISMGLGSSIFTEQELDDYQVNHISLTSKWKPPLGC